MLLLILWVLPIPLTYLAIKHVVRTSFEGYITRPPWSRGDRAQDLVISALFGPIGGMLAVIYFVLYWVITLTQALCETDWWRKPASW